MGESQFLCFRSPGKLTRNRGIEAEIGLVRWFRLSVLVSEIRWLVATPAFSAAIIYYPLDLMITQIINSILVLHA